jgi:UDP-N-acetylglucosamine--N-acetylmuramyl-(pentapeptide) pyrophosphoryl-undecaprenol N-acetylglucosamine transferase
VVDGDRHGIPAGADAAAAGEPAHRADGILDAADAAGGVTLMAGKGTVLLCAGGTGGHLFPAQALAQELASRGYDIHLATDGRAEKFATGFPATIHVVASATFASRNPLAMARAALKLVAGYRQSRALIGTLRPKAAVGFGGYPTLPPMLAAAHMRVPTLIHDANAVMGRANRWLAPRMRQVAMGFAGADAPKGAIVTGNPVRAAVLAAADMPYPARNGDEPLHLLVFGGSQGAQFFAAIVPQAAGLLDARRRELLRVTHQARAEDVAAAGEAWRNLGVEARVAPFFDDMAMLLARAHFVICRAGASSVSELAVVGRPSLLVPYPHALDHDQALNAAALAANGGAEVTAQADLTPERLAQILKRAIDEPQGLALAAKKAKESGRPDATARLADCVMRLGGDETSESRS